MCELRKESQTGGKHQVQCPFQSPSFPPLTLGILCPEIIKVILCDCSSLGSIGWPQTYYVAKNGLKSLILPLCASSSKWYTDMHHLTGLRQC